MRNRGSMTITYKCPSCGSAMEFDGAKQKLVCPHCDNSMSVDEYEQYYKANHTDDKTDGEDGGDEEQSNTNQAEQDDTQESSQGNAERGTQEKVKIFHCSSCGAEPADRSAYIGYNLYLLWKSNTCGRSFGRRLFSIDGDPI